MIIFFLYFEQDFIFLIKYESLIKDGFGNKNNSLFP